MEEEEDPQMTTAEPMDALGLESPADSPQQVEITDEMLEAMDPEERENLISQLIHSDQIPDTLRKPPSEVAIVSLHRKPPPPETSLSRIFYKSGPLGPTYRQQKLREKYKLYWQTKQMVDHGENLELQIQTNLSELLIFILFIIVMCFITYGMLTPGMYYMTKSLERAFLNTNFYQKSGTHATFMDVRTPSDIFEYTTNIIVRYLYYENWYKSVDRTIMVERDDRNILYENRLLGTARLHMVRVGAQSCHIHPSFVLVYAACYDHFNEDSATKSDFVGEAESVWIWKAGDSGTFPYTGQFGEYSIGGYFQDLPYTSTEAFKVIQVLKENVWITRSTRGVFFDFAVYNQNVNLFCIVKLVFEMPATGGVYPSARFTTSKLLRYVNIWDYFVLGCEMTFILFVCYYVLEEVRESIFFGLAYFTYFWNIIDLIIALMALYCAAFILYRAIEVPAQVGHMINTSEHHMNFTLLAHWQNFYNQTMTFIMFMCWCKIFKYLNFNKHMTVLPATITRCSLEIFNYSLVFMINFIAFAQVGYYLFARNVEDYSTFGKVLMTQLRTLLGDFEVNEICTINSLAPTYFVLYVFITYFILLNLFLCILNETYGCIRLEGVHNPKHLTSGNFLLRGFKNLCSCLRIKSSMGEHVSLSERQRVQFIELYEVLKRSNFTENEVEIFMCKYHIDYNGECEPEEVTRLLKELQRKIFIPTRPAELLTSIERQQLEIFAEEKVVRKSGPKTHGITIAEYEQLQARLDQIEIQLETIAERLVASLHTLEKAERNNWAQKKRK